MSKLFVVLITSVALFSFSLVFSMEKEDLSERACKSLAGHLVQKKLEIKEKKTTPRKRKLDKAEEAEEDIPVAASFSGSGSGRSLSSGERFYPIFKRIMETAPEPIKGMPEITVNHEEKEGSRRFVKHFKFEKQEGAQSCPQWHQEVFPYVEAFQKEASAANYLKKSVNVALAKISFFYKGKSLESKEFPLFFVSGWPQNDEKNPITKLAGQLSEGDIEDLDDKHQAYGIRFITQEFKGTAEPKKVDDRWSDSFFDKIHSVMAKEESFQDPPPLLGATRLKFHKKLTKTKEKIKTKLYFHTEQALRSCIRDAIEKYIPSKVGGSSHYAVVDICSFYDMCWCCGDVLLSCTHTMDFGLKVFFRTSGLKRYFDRPFNEIKNISLGEHRKDFKGYASGESYSDDPYYPYVAHAVMEDLKNGADSAKGTS